MLTPVFFKVTFLEVFQFRCLLFLFIKLGAPNFPLGHICVTDFPRKFRGKRDDFLQSACFHIWCEHFFVRKRVKYCNQVSIVALRLDACRNWSHDVFVALLGLNLVMD